MANQIPYLDVQNLTKRFGAQVLFDNISFSIAEGQKVGLVARNGTGKSTLMSVLMDKEGHESGDIIYRRDLKVGYLEQSPKFDPEESVLDACFNHQGDEEKLLKAKQILTQLHIMDLNQPMGQLSGGQQKRVALANVLIEEPDFLMLDEPTNDLDIQTLQVLEEYLQDFAGCVIVVSHDRYFMDKVVDHLLVFKGEGEIQDFPGNYTQYREWSRLQTKEEEASAKGKSAANAPAKTENNAAGTAKRDASFENKRKMTYKEKREYEQLAKEIEALEAEQKQLEEALCSGTLSVDELTEKSKRLPLIKDELDEKEMRWLELAEIEG